MKRTLRSATGCEPSGCSPLASRDEPSRLLSVGTRQPRSERSKPQAWAATRAQRCACAVRSGGCGLGSLLPRKHWKVRVRADDTNNPQLQGFAVPYCSGWTSQRIASMQHAARVRSLCHVTVSLTLPLQIRHTLADSIPSVLQAKGDHEPTSNTPESGE